MAIHQTKHRNGMAVIREKEEEKERAGIRWRGFCFLLVNSRGDSIPRFTESFFTVNVGRLLCAAPVIICAQHGNFARSASPEGAPKQNGDMPCSAVNPLVRQPSRPGRWVFMISRASFGIAGRQAL
jgi:hypothetical protein